FRVLTSMRVALAVVHTLDLSHDRGFARPTFLHRGELGEEECAELVLERLTVSPVKESRLASLRYEDTDPARAQRILATIVDTYTEQNLDKVLSSTSAAVDWLRGQLDHLRQDLEASEMGLHQFKLDNHILSVALDDQSNMLREEMKQLNEALTAARTKHGEV